MKLKKWICRCLLLGLLTLFCIFIFLSLEGPQREQKEIAEHIIRFHVIANSDSERDQSLKLMVRDAVLKQMDVWTKHSQNLAETRSVLNSHLSDIEALAQETLEKEGCEAPVSVSLETCYFPVKTYGEMTFPAGNYEALRIQIGQAQGRNWWCVLYPPLCFLDASGASVSNSSKSLLQETLSGQAYESLYGTSESTLAYGKQLAEDILSGKTPLKSKLAEWLQELFSAK